MKGDLKCQDRERVLVREGNQYKAGRTIVILVKDDTEFAAVTRKSEILL